MDDTITQSPEFEKIYVATLLRDQDFYAHVFQDISPEMFGNPAAQRLVRVLLAYTQETGSIPDSLIYHEIDKHKATLPGEVFNSLKAYVDELMVVPLRDRQYLIKEHDKFIRGKLLKSMVPKLIEFGRKDDHDGIAKLFEEYIAFRPAGVMDPGSEYRLNMLEERIKRRKEHEDHDRFLFLIKPLDERGVYFSRKDVVVIQSQKTSMGKTAMLLHLTRSLVVQEKKVLIYTLEESEEQIEDRLDQTITGLPIEDMTDKVKVISRMRTWTDGLVRIKKFPAYDTTVDQLIAHHNMLKNHFGFYPDVIIINASDDITPKYGKDNLYLGGRDIYRQIVAWADRENVGMVTDMQSNRGAAEKTVAGTEDVQGSIAKAQLATLVMSINRTAAEAQEGLTSLHVGKSRFGASFFTVSIKSDLARGQIYLRE